MLSRRRLWAVCIFFSFFCILYINTNIRQSQFGKNGFNLVEKERGELVKINKNSSNETVLKDEEMEQAEDNETMIMFRGDIETPKVEIEINGHSILFNDVESRPSPTSNIRVHLIFHSHVDPGWLKTFEEYYQTKVKNILSNAVESLRQHKDLRFIWSETSFLERWWRDATEEEKENIKEQVKRGQLEISGGAWVMTDEATPTFYAAIENMIEGHSFIHQQFKITPNTSWSVDPFGHGTMMPELLSLAGVEAMVIGRFNEHLKQKLRAKQAMRFQWVPPYFIKIEGPRVNSLPHLVYTTQDACEDHSTCMCYHVGPSALWQSYCGDGKLLHLMTNETIPFMTRRFVEQMRKVQRHYGTEDLLVAIGDDFFFGNITDWDQMYTGFAQMIEYLKTHPEEKAQMTFSTVSNFFDSIKNEKLYSMRGDLFPYTSDMKKPNPWWTGYFVHRPYTKTMERRLQNSLRALDIVTMLSKRKEKNIEKLTEAKRELALFQHHDGITGTSKPLVMEDYEKRMGHAFRLFSELFLETVFDGKGQLSFNGTSNIHNVLILPENGKLYLSAFSSQTHLSTTLLKVRTNKAIKVESSDGTEILSRSIEIDDNIFEVEFGVSLTPLSITSFILTAHNRSPSKSLSKCWKINNTTGQIEELLLQKEVIPFSLSLFEIGDSGGAYVFSGDGKSIYLKSNSSVETSDLMDRVVYSQYQRPNLKMTVTCLKEGHISVEIDTDMEMYNTLMMAMKTDLRNSGFHTDVNGLYHLRRKYEKKFNNNEIPLEANIFPSATSSFIESNDHRLTIVTGQPTGVTSDESGILKLLVDRRVNNDDGKGLDYGDCFDNRTSNVKFQILLEKRKKNNTKHSFLSLTGEHTVNEVLYPPILVVSNESLVGNLKNGPEQWPCAIQLVLWRMLTEKIGVLILRKYNVNEMIPEEECQQNSLRSLFDYFSSSTTSFHHTRLTATEDAEVVSFDSFQKSLLSPFSLVSFRLYF